MLIYVFVFDSLGQLLRSGMVRQYGTCMFNFLWNFQIVFQKGCNILYTTAMYKNSDCFIFSPVVGIVTIFNFSYLMGMFSIPLWLIFVLPRWLLMAEHIFLFILPIGKSSFLQYPFKKFSHFLIQLFVFLKLGCSFFVFYTHKSFVWQMCYKYFLWVGDLPFYFLNSVFEEQIFNNFCKANGKKSGKM